MKYLSEISRIVTNFREENVEIIDENFALGSDDAVSKLYAGLKNRSIDTDQKAAEVVYGKPILNTRYTTLKGRLKRRLINSLFFLNIRPPAFSEYASALYQSNKNLFIIKTLSALGARNTAIKLLESALAHSQKFSLTLNSIEFLRLLRLYSSFMGNEKAYDSYNSQLKKAIKTFEAEIIAIEYNEKVAIKFAKSSEEHPEMQGIIESYCQNLSLLRKDYDSKDLNYNYFRIQTLFNQISRNYLEAIKTCIEAEDYIVANPHLFSKNQVGEFLLQKLTCFLILRQFEKGKEVVAKLDDLYDPKTLFGNWFIYMEYSFYLSMHTEHFQEAENIYKKVVEYPKFSSEPDHKKENWKLFEIYLQFALRVSSASGTVQKEYTAIDINKFIRNVPSYTKDKKGFNVAILILQILLLLENNEFGEIINRMDALRTYRTRYLRAGSNKKSALFFRMLQIMETNHFSYEATKKKSQKYFDQMQSIAAEFSEIQDGLQVLPFDWMWNKILEMLKQKEEQKIITQVGKGKASKGRAQELGYAVPGGRSPI